jgi:hypothetical protein
VSDEQSLVEEKRLRLLVDATHGEDLSWAYEQLVESLSERCQVSVLKKKPLDLNLLNENDAFVVICASKTWDDAEVSTIRQYVESHGGILLVLAFGRGKPEHLNKLLSPYDLSVDQTTLKESDFRGDNLQGCQPLEGVESPPAGTGVCERHRTLTGSGGVEIVLQFKRANLGAKTAFGKATVYLITCLNVLGKKDLERRGNATFLANLLECLATPAVREH